MKLIKPRRPHKTPQHLEHGAGTSVLTPTLQNKNPLSVPVLGGLALWNGDPTPNALALDGLTPWNASLIPRHIAALQATLQLVISPHVTRSLSLLVNPHLHHQAICQRRPFPVRVLHRSVTLPQGRLTMLMSPSAFPPPHILRRARRVGSGCLLMYPLGNWGIIMQLMSIRRPNFSSQSQAAFGGTIC